jgi:hypothetical protein
MKKWVSIVGILILPFVVIDIYFRFSRSNQNLIVLNYIVLFVCSFFPLLSIRYIKRSMARIVLGVLIVPVYICLLIAWILGLNFSISGQAF